MDAGCLVLSMLRTLVPGEVRVGSSMLDVSPSGRSPLLPVAGRCCDSSASSPRLSACLTADHFPLQTNPPPPIYSTALYNAPRTTHREGLRIDAAGTPALLDELKVSGRWLEIKSSYVPCAMCHQSDGQTTTPGIPTSRTRYRTWALTGPPAWAEVPPTPLGAYPLSHAALPPKGYQQPWPASMKERHTARPRWAGRMQYPTIALP